MAIQQGRQTNQAPTHPTQRTERPPASWRRFATRPRNPITGITMYGPWSSLRPYALKLLKHDHRVIRRILKELDRSGTGGSRSRILSRAEAELVCYSRVTNEVFYPAYRSVCKTATQRKWYHEAMEQHRAVELLLGDLRRCEPESAKFGGCARALRIAVGELFHEEEHTMFHYARRLMGRANLKALGRSMQDHRRAILRNPNLPPMSTSRAVAV